MNGPVRAPIAAVAGGVRRILVVDDELLIRWSLRETLSDRGYMVAEAHDGESAIRALTADPERPHVVLLDYRLPDSDDLTLLSRIVGLVPDGCVILMTAYGTPEVTQGAIERGAFTVLQKPFELHELAALVSRFGDLQSPATLA
jgi:two-component system response regulator AtoC